MTRVRQSGFRIILKSALLWGAAAAVAASLFGANLSAQSERSSLKFIGTPVASLEHGVEG